jgi:hypothetical protein
MKRRTPTRHDDVQFNEDPSRIRSGHAANKPASVRHIAMNLLRLDTRARQDQIKAEACRGHKLVFALNCPGS